MRASIDRRIQKLEKSLTDKGFVPGTTLIRVLYPDQNGYCWSLGVGPLGRPQKFYTGDTIEEVLSLAEKDWMVRTGKELKGNWVQCLHCGQRFTTKTEEVRSHKK